MSWKEYNSTDDWDREADSSLTSNDLKIKLNDVYKKSFPQKRRIISNMFMSDISIVSMKWLRNVETWKM